MRKVVSWGLVLAMLALLLTGCSGGSKSGSSNQKQLKIGIIQIVEHPALDAARKGFIDGLKAGGYEDGKQIKIDYQNAQGDQSMLQTIAKKLVSNNSDLILAVATPAAQAVAADTTKIPTLFTAVTDPVAAKLVKAMDRPGSNLTGTTDMNPVKEQVDLLKQLVPGAKKVGVIYNAGEVNSTVQVKKLKEVAGAVGLQVVDATVSNSSEVLTAAQSLVGRVQAIYVPTDNVVASAIQSVVKVSESSKLPVIAGEDNMVKGGALATYGIDYYKLGQQTAQMAIKILKGEAKPESLAVESQKDLTLTINMKSAAKLGITIPEDMQKKATLIK